ncbi:hypothetical protein JM79_2014 [Gramella sp. Hel_I_59]|uniref:hypothetical protein n=1 Tax=Gramella sp. Hel_I_59 TaxID=1249978 RepID=UPI001153CCC2|nr:hypothetical protein [Gramella sp. Hel_I_59]TQI71088.1 hypothetical protein JM79_2014 [Gramella sp. Hel_I_59]
MLKKIFVFITVLTLQLSCIDKFDHPTFEKQVSHEIFPQLMDSLHFDQRLKFPIPPPPPPSEPNEQDKNFEKYKIDSADLEKRIKSYEKQKIELYNDSVKLMTAIRDSTLLLDEEDKRDFLNFYSLNIKDIDTVSINKKYKIDIRRLNADPKINFIYRSKLPGGREIWNTDHGFYLNSIVSISRIQFDRNRKFGVMTAGYSMGFMNGVAFRIFIRKNNEGKWVIDKIQTTYIS